jgi:hypothetical protein
MKIRKQKGLSLIGFLLVLSLVIFSTFIALRIAPIYMEYWSVVSAMNGIQAENGSSRWSPFDIRMGVLNRLYVSYSDDNIKDKNIKVIRAKDGVRLRIVYEVRKPLMGNLDVVAHFDRSVILH